MGIIGAVCMLPSLGCALICGALAGDTTIGLIIGLIPIVLGIFGGIKGKSSPTLSMVLLLFSAILALIAYILSPLSLMNFAALVLFLIGGIMAKAQKME
jgi:hypothetical protein